MTIAIWLGIALLYAVLVRVRPATESRWPRI